MIWTTFERVGSDTRAVEDEVLEGLRAEVDIADALGVIAITVLIPVALHDDVSYSISLPWAIAEILCVIGWSHRRVGLQLPPWVASASLWASSLLWAALPWLVGGAIDDDRVALVVLAVGGWGLATDAIMVPQTARLRTATMMAFYACSYVAAFVAVDRLLAACALTIFTAHLAVGTLGIERIRGRVVDMRADAIRSAMVDPLTGLPSRWAAHRETAQRLEDGHGCCCLLIDIDNFKQINTHFGSEGGDAVLHAVARSIEGVLEGWFLARVGGDEFLAVNDRLPTDIERAELTTLSLDAIESAGGPSVVTASVGVAAAGSHNDSLAAGELIRLAATALVEAKRLGKERVIDLTEDLRTRVEHRRDLARRARQALRQGEFIAWGQPLVDLEQRNRWVGVELLARWPQPDGSMGMPGDFVPAIEAQGLSRLLGRAMLREAADLLRRLGDRGHPNIFVTVNLAAVQVIDPALPDFLRATFGPDAPLACLVIEMTETQRVDDPDRVDAAIRGLRSLGVGVASDDVGSGWSTINQVLEAPFSHIKVDRGLITGSARPGGVELMAAIRGLAEHSQQLAIAEGIETADELGRVRQAGFRLGQGFLFAKPMPVDLVVLHLDDAS